MKELIEPLEDSAAAAGLVDIQQIQATPMGPEPCGHDLHFPWLPSLGLSGRSGKVDGSNPFSEPFREFFAWACGNPSYKRPFFEQVEVRLAILLVPYQKDKVPRLAVILGPLVHLDLQVHGRAKVSYKPHLEQEGIYLGRCREVFERVQLFV